eukprot:801817_1
MNIIHTTIMLSCFLLLLADLTGAMVSFTEYQNYSCSNQVKNQVYPYTEQECKYACFWDKECISFQFYTHHATLNQSVCETSETCDFDNNATLSDDTVSLFIRDSIPNASLPTSDVSGFGVRTSKDWFSNTPGASTVVLTLWLNSMMYTCSIKPTQIDTLYFCDDSNFTVVGEYCNYIQSEAKIMIDNSKHHDGVGIGTIFVNTTYGFQYEISGYCIGNELISMNAHYTKYTTKCDIGGWFADSMCVDNEMNDCEPGKQVVRFNANTPDVNITNAVVADGTNETMNIDQICYPMRVRSLGIKTSANGTAQTNGYVTITLWFESYMFQCTVKPRVENTEYGCDMDFGSYSARINVLGPQCGEQSKILVYNSWDGNAVMIDDITITTMSGVYQISGVCVNSTTQGKSNFYTEFVINDSVCADGFDHFTQICVDHQMSGGSSCGPGKQLIVFNENQPGVVNDAIWMNGTAVSVQSWSCDPTNSPSSPSTAPTRIPSIAPTMSPSTHSTAPTRIPPIAPTRIPSTAPTRIPSIAPTMSPSTHSTAPTRIP